jgi:hypothetical protein
MPQGGIPSIVATPRFTGTETVQLSASPGATEVISSRTRLLWPNLDCSGLFGRSQVHRIHSLLIQVTSKLCSIPKRC